MPLTLRQLDRVKQLRSSMTYDAILGNYKNFKNAKKEYAVLAIKDFNTVRQLPAPKVIVPLFSRQGIQMLFVMVRDFFRVKTPEEKILKKMGNDYKSKLKVNQFIENA